MSVVKTVLSFVGGLAVGGIATAIGAKKYWTKKYAGGDDKKDQTIKSLEEENTALHKTIAMMNDSLEKHDTIDIKDTEHSRPETTDYTSMYKKVPNDIHSAGVEDATKEDKYRSKVYFMDEEDLTVDEINEAITGCYYKKSDDYLEYGSEEPMSKDGWKDDPWCYIHDGLKRAVPGDTLYVVDRTSSIMTVYAIDIESGEYEV